ncbi:hypothetical protein [Haliangium sp. UPWRP_2]|nr:hypothetical protein [Haliangium sp. UPWRP_2]
MIKPILNMRAIYHTGLTSAYKWISPVGGAAHFIPGVQYGQGYVFL